MEGFRLVYAFRKHDGVRIMGRSMRWPCLAAIPRWSSDCAKLGGGRCPVRIVRFAEGKWTSAPFSATTASNNSSPPIASQVHGSRDSRKGRGHIGLSQRGVTPSDNYMPEVSAGAPSGVPGVGVSSPPVGVTISLGAALL
jgi:hypothetical protein